ncbi:hypothetical protein AXK56_16380 [Tsukamurella pulmonis]|uniref:DUF8175 domain-containing protein n=1 Tax=Tsukamurella pulmonis TaxID=47312 RepID=A0A1H1A7H1_9ACTN|nr:hypothetical protein [Tsukamurella pulmonis]KXO95788.1 hypothetical protein AXK56_16380 [Tsukamurella pulmonis]SDQ35603.1 hypothetical protein SAMN04489765_0089 [Tsukamurella pulmonis]SUQ39449.1 Uncharacterised protein [Tsukamurella pulmonis]
MSYNNDYDEGYKAVQQTVGNRVQAVRSSRPYRYGTLGLSILVITTIIAGAVWVLFTNRTDEKADSPAASSVPPATAPAETNGQDPDVRDQFGAPSADVFGRALEVPLNPLGAVLPQRAGKNPTNPSAAPEGLMWQKVYGAAVPFSTSDGPTKVGADGVPSGFSQTPRGAILAGMQVMRRLVGAPRNQVPALRSEMMTVPAGMPQESLESLVPTFTLTQDEIFAASPIPLAFKVTEARKDYVHFEVASPVSGQLQARNIVAIRTWTDMVWKDGHWKMVVSTENVPAEARYVYGALDSNWVRW